MATPSGRHGIITVAEHVQQLSSADPSAIQRVARDVQAALAEQGPGRSTQESQALEQQGDTAACITAAVQCAGWLVQAASHEQHVGPAMCAAQLCIQKATRQADVRRQSPGPAVCCGASWWPHTRCGFGTCLQQRVVSNSASRQLMPQEPSYPHHAHDLWPTMCIPILFSTNAAAHMGVLACSVTILSSMPAAGADPHGVLHALHMSR